MSLVVHLPANGKTLRANPWGQAYKLTEQGPMGSDPQTLLEITKWLGVEKNGRYKPTGSTTFCNVYAYDYCCLANAYLPRVWWLPNSLKLVEAGNDVTPVLGKTVSELSANALYRWLDTHSSKFGWQKLSSLDEAQEAANRGEAVVICARRKVEAASGHISCVVPESDKVKAIRDANGNVTLPVQSQAGGRNVELGNISAWWLGSEFAEYGFWRCSSCSV